MSPITHEQRIAMGKKGGTRSGEKATERRLAKWREWGVDPVVGQRIYTAGFMCAYAQMRRKNRQAVTS